MTDYTHKDNTEWMQGAQGKRWGYLVKLKYPAKFLTGGPYTMAL